LWRDGEITHRNDLGKVYIATTVITCITGFGIFQHGGFGKPHALGVITLPMGKPLFDSPEAPGLQIIGGVLFLIFLVGAYVQVKRLGRR
jgi:hypothetical protein